MVWLFGDRFGMNAAFLGIIALAVFSFSFLTGILRKIRGNDRLILFSAFGLGLARLLVQVQWPEPLAGMLLSLTGILFFGGFMSAYLDKVRAAGKAGIGNLVTGLLAGLLFDTALHGAFRTYDMAWQPGILPLILTIILVFIHCLGGVLSTVQETGSRKCVRRYLAVAGTRPFPVSSTGCFPEYRPAECLNRLAATVRIRLDTALTNCRVIRGGLPDENQPVRIIRLDTLWNRHHRRDSFQQFGESPYFRS
jgi:hypothetical protein